MPPARAGIVRAHPRPTPPCNSVANVGFVETHMLPGAFKSGPAASQHSSSDSERNDALMDLQGPTLGSRSELEHDTLGS
jgi:hypothetical protein